MNVAIIPARGGSRRIPKKNIRDFCGKPMIARSIEAAQSVEIFDRIIVTTDSDEIATVAQEWGAEVPFMRPPELSDDFAGTDAVFTHALRFLLEQEAAIDFACCIYATAPFIRSEYLKQGLELLQESKASSAFSVTSYAFPVFRAQKINSEGILEMQWPEHRMTRSQDLPELYHDAGQFYWTKVPRYMLNPSLYAEALPVILPRYLVQDIDTEEDWKRAELMYKALDQ
jgi:pseudaminic acid cytidylyltransferase